MRLQLPQPAAAEIAAPAAPLLLTDQKLLDFFRGQNAPLPFGLTRLRQDRHNGCLGGVPHRRLAGKCLYSPEEIGRWLAGLPIIQAKPLRQTARTGRPSAGELAEAARRGITVRELRAQQTQANIQK